LAGYHGALRGVNDLFEKGYAGTECDAEGDHMCTITDSTLNLSNLFFLDFCTVQATVGQVRNLLILRGMETNVCPME
jgi:hypothetical protein